MTSFGLGEVLIVLILILISFDIKQIGRAMKWFKSVRNKFYSMQSDFKYQFNNLIAQEEAKEELEKIYTSSEEMRSWGAKQVRRYSRVKKLDAARDIMEKLDGLTSYQDAKIIAAYSSLHDELTTSGILKKILDDGKTLLLPYVKDKKMFFAAVKDIQEETSPGMFGILEPLEEQRRKQVPEPDLFFIPGRTFDENGGRIGRGKGFYDRYLSEHSGIKIGLCLDPQISTRNLPLKEHDINMDFVISEKQLIDAREKGKSKDESNSST